MLLLLGLWLQLSLGLVPGNQEAPEAPHSQGAAPGSPDLHSPLGQLRRKTLPSGTARQPRPLMWLRSCSPSRQPPKMSSSSWGMVSVLSRSTPSPHSPGTLGCQMTQAGPRDSDLTQCVPSGMGVSTVTATRILKGQMDGKPGPETPLAMDQFPYMALSKVRAK